MKSGLHRIMPWGSRAALSIVLFALGVAAAPASADEFKSGPVTYVTSTINIPAGEQDAATGFCPGDRNVSGGGASIAGDTGEADDADISTMQPADFVDGDAITDDAWIADASNDDNVSHALTTTAVCVKTSKADISYVESESPYGAGVIAGGTAVACGGGGEITSGGLSSDSSSADLIELEALEHSFNGKDPSYNVLSAGFTKEGAAIDVTTFGLCTVEALEHRYKDRIIFGPGGTIKAKCPKGARVLGGGFSRYPTDLIASAPFDGNDADSAPDDGWKVKMTTLAPIAGFAYAHCF